MFSELPGSVVWCLTLIWGKFSTIIASNISSVPFFLLLLVASLGVSYTFLVVSFLLDVLFQFFSGFFLFAFQFWKLLHILKHRDSFLSPSKAFSISVTVLLKSSISFYSQNFHPSACIAHLFLHAVYFFY